MITKTETLYGCRVTENPIPTINANPSIVLTGNGKRFGISRDQLSTHCLLLGSTGTGKTNAILHFVKQLKASMKSDDVMLVFDSKLDFVKFHNADDYIISNQRNSVAVSADWNIFMDIVADGWDKEAIILNADEIAEVVFSDSIAHSSQPFFPTAARDVFAAILKAMTFLGISDMDYRIKHLACMALICFAIRAGTVCTPEVVSVIMLALGNSVLPQMYNSIAGEEIVTMIGTIGGCIAGFVGAIIYNSCWAPGRHTKCYEWYEYMLSVLTCPQLF